MGPEANIDSTRTLEKQIEEGAGDVVQPDVSEIPYLDRRACCPRYLSSPSIRTSSQKGDFLLVCCHWFEVAYETPELWSLGVALWNNGRSDVDVPGPLPSTL